MCVPFYCVQLSGEDVKDVDFIVVYEANSIFITGNIRAHRGETSEIIEGTMIYMIGHTWEQRYSVHVHT